MLSWLDDNTDGKPYGVDIVMPMKIPTEGTSVDLKAMIPDAHISFVEKTLQKLGVPPLPEGEGREGVLGWLHSIARSHLDVALKHRPVLIANALGSPPKDVIDLCHEHGIKVAALAGAAKHALSHVHNGVDIIVAQGFEAGGHTGEIASMVLTPEIVDAVGPDVPVLGAGGIGSRSPGRRIARAGLPGRVDGLDLARHRGVPEPDLQQGLGRRRSPGPPRPTPCAPGSTPASPPGCSRPSGPRPGPRTTRRRRCPMPLQNLLVADAHNRINSSNDPDVISMPIGQIVGRMNEVRPVAEVMADLVSEFEATVKRLDEITG